MQNISTESFTSTNIFEGGELIGYIKGPRIFFYEDFNSKLSSKIIRLLFDHHITEIEFDTYGKFNKSIDNLPDHIRVLILSKKFNKPINKLPAQLEHLELEDRYNHPLDNLPLNLKFLRTGNSFDHPLDFLPFGLEKLFVGRDFSYPLLNLSQSLKILSIDSDIKPSYLDNLPDSIEELEFKYKNHIRMSKLPGSIKKIYYYFEFDDGDGWNTDDFNSLNMEFERKEIALSDVLLMNSELEEDYKKLIIKLVE